MSGQWISKEYPVSITMERNALKWIAEMAVDSAIESRDIEAAEAALELLAEMRRVGVNSAAFLVIGQLENIVETEVSPY
jgi:hypothetical protein